jgi:hypothetical protein
MGSIGIGCSEARTTAIDLGDLTAFVAVTRGGGFRPAAGASGGCASSFSEAVSRLEARLGVPLLNRTARSITPTEAGAPRSARSHDVTEAEPKSSGRKVLLPIEIGHQPGLLRLPPQQPTSTA